LKGWWESVKTAGTSPACAPERGRRWRVNQGQELVIAGYTPSPKNFDALVVGYYDGPSLMYAARTRNGFTPASRAELFKKLTPLEIKKCPFANLPEKKTRRCGCETGVRRRSQK
jgi:ATP-dependent DNA ligase